VENSPYCSGSEQRNCRRRLLGLHRGTLEKGPYAPSTLADFKSIGSPLECQATTQRGPRKGNKLLSHVREGGHQDQTGVVKRKRGKKKKTYEKNQIQGETNKTKKNGTHTSIRTERNC